MKRRFTLDMETVSNISREYLIVERDWIRSDLDKGLIKHPSDVAVYTKIHDAMCVVLSEYFGVKE